MKTTSSVIKFGSVLLATVGLVTAATGATSFVTVSGSKFRPSDLTVNVGDTVVFSGGSAFHTVTGDGAEPFCGTAGFTTCSVTFTNEGTFTYHCIPHQTINMTGVVHVVVAVTSQLTLVVHGQGTVTPDLNGQDLIVGNRYTVTAQPAAGHAFNGWTGGITSSTARLTFNMQSNLMLEANFEDALKPVLAVTSPRPNARLTNGTVTLAGTARDNDSFTVEYRIETATSTNDYQAASGTTNWSVELNDLTPGAYRFRVRARDATGNLSTEMTRSLQVLARLTVTAEDEDDGTVTGGFLGTSYREVGRRLSLLAVSQPGYLFSNWIGDFESTANPLVFIIQSNVTLQANFVDNPFLPLKGSFSGLFHVNMPTNLVRHENSGSFTFSLTDRGRYTGLLHVGGKRRPFSGQFGLDGKSTNSVKQAGTNSLSMELMLDLIGDSDVVMGQVVDPEAGWTAGVLGDRAPVYVGTNASPYKGRYTFILESEDDTEPEMGISYGTVVVNAKGKLTFLANLADGTTASQSAMVSKDGYWPLYTALYGGRGSILSWVTVVTNQAPDDSLSGDLSWIKPTLPRSKFYTPGFTNIFYLRGSLYQPPVTNKVLQIHLGNVRFEDGNLSRSFTNVVTLGSKNKVINLTTSQPLLLNLTLPTGLFNGSVTVMDGGMTRKLLFKGALLQHQNFGAGYFPGTDETGSVEFEAAP